MTVTLCALCAAAYLADQQLAADAKLAMKRADLSVDYVARATSYSRERLSDQLNGKEPFTAFWRFFVGEMRETEFRAEFFAIQAARIDGFFMRGERAVALLTRMDVLLGTTPKPIAKADLRSEPEQKVRVS